MTQHVQNAANAVIRPGGDARHNPADGTSDPSRTQHTARTASEDSDIDWRVWDHLIASVADYAIAERIGCDPRTVSNRRKTLGRQKYSWQKATAIPEEAVALYGKEFDRTIAARFGIGINKVSRDRRARGIEPKARHQRWSDELVDLFNCFSAGVVAKLVGVSSVRACQQRSICAVAPDFTSQPLTDNARILTSDQPEEEIARHFGVDVENVRHVRKRIMSDGPGGLVNRTMHQRHRHRFTPAMDLQIGTDTDPIIAGRFGYPVEAVRQRRQRLKKPAFRTPSNADAWARGEDA